MSTIRPSLFGVMATKEEWNYNLDPLFAKYDKLQKRHMVHPWAISMIWTPTIIPLI